MDGHPQAMRGDKQGEVIEWQTHLKALGYDQGVDGLFINTTLNNTKRFQRDQLLLDDGIVGSVTYDAMAELLDARVYLERFRGSILWVHNQEGHNGKPYWPGSDSGVTLDPGVDLGYADIDEILSAYHSLLNQPMVEEIHRVKGLKKKTAKTALENLGALAGFRISREEASHIFPIVAKSYWDDICERYNTLRDSDTPGAIQTALLSIAYNRGAKNSRLSVLNTSMDNRDWNEVGNVINSMQQTHKLKGIRERRQKEAQIIKDYAL